MGRCARSWRQAARPESGRIWAAPLMDVAMHQALVLRQEAPGVRRIVVGTEYRAELGIRHGTAPDLIDGITGDHHVGVNEEQHFSLRAGCTMIRCCGWPALRGSRQHLHTGGLHLPCSGHFRPVHNNDDLVGREPRRHCRRQAALEGFAASSRRYDERYSQ